MSTALFSLSDKTGLVELARPLQQLGWSLVASGGTATVLKENGLPVREVADLTGSPEILGGRVKTLHPAVHGGILSRRLPEDQAELDRLQWGAIDLVAVNLYPFEQTISREGVLLADAVEQIDIGGVALLRAAAKNFQHVVVLCDPADYPGVLAELQSGGVSESTRRRLATKAFARTCAYDQAIADYLAGDAAPTRLTLHPAQALRYGENPHQQARLYSWEPGTGPLGGQLLQGKELSYNNLLDLDAAWRASGGFGHPVCIVVKHLCPCGAALGENGAQAVRRAIDADKVSAFGGILAVNCAFDEEMAAELGDLFLECIAAPAFTAGAREKLSGRKNLRLLEIARPVETLEEYRTIQGGMLWQQRDVGRIQESEWTVASQRPPSDEEWSALRFNWKIVHHVRSNAIVVGTARQTLGVGGGQTNRVDAVKHALERAGANAVNAVLASDAFFPFSDSLELCAAAGIRAVIQPGGSVRDADTIAAADKHDIALVLTGRRHFRH
jgi:phosphoribosylaminoimidazolecarboxamide formyltransferase / IMP cyclohydrolase